MVEPEIEGTILALAKSAESIDISILTRNAAVLVLTPHPDDESLGCGAAVAAACQSGVEIVVACLTDGSRSHPNSSAYPRDKLAALRLAELESAVGILSGGKGKTVALGVPDQGVTKESLAEMHVLEVLDELIRSHDIGTVWTTWQNDAHIDHQHAAGLALGLCAANARLRLWQFPIWSRFTGQTIGCDERLSTFDSTQYLALKRRAIAAHRSQMSPLIGDDPEGFTLDRAKQAHFLTFPEIFITRSRNERQTPHF